MKKLLALCFTVSLLLALSASVPVMAEKQKVVPVTSVSAGDQFTPYVLITMGEWNWPIMPFAGFVPEVWMETIPGVRQGYPDAIDHPPSVMNFQERVLDNI